MVTIFDIEANGKLEDVTEIHCIAVANDGRVKLFGPDEIKQGIEHLSNSDMLVGHNILCYDLPALAKTYGFKWQGKVFDTLNVSRLIYTNLFDIDISNREIQPKFYGKHSLESWGHRLGEYKGDFHGPWDEYTSEMGEYCKQDALVTAKLYDKLVSKNYSKEAIEIEHEFQKLIHIQETNGILFDTKTAEELAGRVGKDIDDLKRKLSSYLQVRIRRGGVVVPKRNDRKLGRRRGCSYNKISFDDPNPGSRSQVVQFFKQKYGWEPNVFTDKGNPKVDDEVLRGLKYPEASEFGDLFERIKIQGYLKTGRNAWTKLVKNGRIHGHVITNGAVTGRCTHSNPNLSQVPSVRKYLGKECRSLFHAGRGHMIGADASGLELRMLAHYLSRYDGGKYTKEILTGDIHEANQRAAELETRDQAKTFIYAFIYGAGNAKLGSIVTGTKDETGNRKIGSALRESFLSKVEGLRDLIRDVQNQADKNKYLRSLDGRHLHIRSNHKALNTLLQGGGAVVMKKANIIFWETNWECQQVLNIHDEWEVVTNLPMSHCEMIGEGMVDSIVKAGEYFKLNIPLDGEYRIGKNWMEVH